MSGKTKTQSFSSGIPDINNNKIIIDYGKKKSFQKRNRVAITGV